MTAKPMAASLLSSDLPSSRLANPRSQRARTAGMRLLSYSSALLFLVLPAELSASLCVPLGNSQAIHFSSVLKIHAAASPSAASEAWVLSDQSVYRISRGGKVETWSLPGQLKRDAF